MGLKRQHSSQPAHGQSVTFGWVTGAAPGSGAEGAWPRRRPHPACHDLPHKPRGKKSLPPETSGRAAGICARLAGISVGGFGGVAAA